LAQQLVSQEKFQHDQQKTNSRLLQSLDNLHILMQAQQQQQALFTGGGASSPRQLSVLTGGGAADRTSSGNMALLSPTAAGAGPSRSISAAHRFNSMAATATSKMLAPFAGHKAKSSTALAGADGVGLLRSPFDVSTPASPTAAGPDACVGVDHAAPQTSRADASQVQQQGTAAAAAGDSAELVRSLQQQLDEQRQTLLLQQDLLQQVLARLPPRQG
jgi:hypothetical protein